MKNYLRKIVKACVDKDYRILVLSGRGFYNSMNDKTFLKMKFKAATGYEIDLRNPQTFNEKLQWLKLYDRNPNYTKLVDKYEVKKYIANIIGEEYVIPTLGIYDKFEDINFRKLPKRFVIKCTHDSGGLVICKDKSKLDIKSAKRKINKSLRRNYYYGGREWPYKNVKPRIIVEKYMEDDTSEDIKDYKFFCFDGEPKVMYISENLHSDNQKIIFYNDKFEEIDISRTDSKDFIDKPSKPVNFDEMLELSKKLSYGIPHVRVDWYEINGKLYFGELTFYTGAGWIPFTKKKYDYQLGSYLNLPKNRKLK